MTLAILAGALIFAGCNNAAQVAETPKPVINALFWSDNDVDSRLGTEFQKLKDCPNLNNELKKSTLKEGSESEYVEGQDFPYSMILMITDTDKNSKLLYLSPDKDFPKDKTKVFGFNQKYEDTSCGWKDFRFTDIPQSSVTLYAYVEDARNNKSKVFSVDLTFTNVE